MSKEKEILPHGPLKQLDENLWTVDGTLPHHMPLPRTMTIFKMNDGGLLIHSAIALDEPTQRKMEALGKPKYLLVPSTMHRLDAPHYKALYPSITVVCPEAATEKVAEKVPVDESCENAFQGSEVIAHKIPGAKPIEMAYEVPLAAGGRAMIFNDLLVNVTETPGVLGFFLKAIGRVGALRSPPSNKLILLDDRSKFKEWLKVQSKRNDLRILTVAHGDAVTNRVPQLLSKAAQEV